MYNYKLAYTPSVQDPIERIERIHVNLSEVHAQQCKAAKVMERWCYKLQDLADKIGLKIAGPFHDGEYFIEGTPEQIKTFKVRILKNREGKPAVDWEFRDEK